MPSAVKPRGREPSLGQHRHVAGGPVAEPEVGADHDGTACSTSTRMRSTNSSGDQAATSRVNGRASTASTPASLEQRGALLDRGQRRRGVVGSQHRHRVRVEGDGDDGQSALVGDLAGPGPRRAGARGARRRSCRPPRRCGRGRPGPRRVSARSARREDYRRRRSRRTRPRPGPARRAARRARGTRRPGRRRAAGPAGRGRARGRSGRRAACSSLRSTAGKHAARGVGDRHHRRSRSASVVEGAARRRA